MKKLALIGALAGLALAGTASAQMSSTTTQAMPNGNVRTTTRVDTMGGHASTTTVDRPDGSRAVIHRQTDAMGDSREVRRDDRGGWHNRRTCRTTWHHGQRMRRCWSNHRGW